jgi:hypothetical protein
MMLNSENIKFKISLVSYYKYWLLFLFITSFVVTNAIKGATLAFLFAGISIILICFANKENGRLYLRLYAKLIAIFVASQIFSQFIIIIFDGLPDYTNLILVSNDSRAVFRTSLFTQSLYLILSFSLFVFTTVYYRKPVHDKYIELGLLLMIFYGFYTWLFFLLTGEDGDFISNREFGDGIINPGHFQTINIGGLYLLRFVSLTGEPSMYVFSILPFSIYFLYERRYILVLLLFVTLLLTFSGTLIIGLLTYAFALLFTSTNTKKLLYYLSIILAILIIVLTNEVVMGIINEVFLAKIMQESLSGEDRFLSIFNNITFFLELPFFTKILGVGFGFIRSPEFFTTLIVNNGLLGLALFTLLFFFPIVKLSSDDIRNKGIKFALLVTYVMLLASVSEYSYPCVWLLLGIAYKQLFFERSKFLVTAL